jgi:pimeloyl-ACP methyl ester carboxylesterase
MGMKRLLATATTIGLVVAGATASSAQAAPIRGVPSFTPAPITWGACSDVTLMARKAQCGFVTVPLDYAHPSGMKIKLAVSRVVHTVPAAKYQGVMLVNPGGPGGAGLALSVLGQFVPKKAGDAYDWIGFDPRGVGTSVPALTCDAGYFGYNRPDYVPATAALENAWRARTKKYAKACDKAGGPLLDHLKTTDLATDMDSIRKALGQQKINFYGFSYGTYLGQVYATRYPNRVRRMVLDGNVDPRRVWYNGNLDQDLAFERSIKVFFGWLAKYDAVYHLGKTQQIVERRFYAERAKLAVKPAGGLIGPDELTDVFLQAGYYVFGWEGVAKAFASWVAKGDGVPLKELYDKGNPKGKAADNGYAIYLAVQCTDIKWPSRWPKWVIDNWRLHRKAPFETWGNAWYNAPCRHWGGKAGTPVDVDGRKAPPALLISETLDAATPFAGSLEVRKRFPRSALIEGVGGTTHAGTLFGDACIDDTIADYLATGVVPRRLKADRADKRCAPLPQPNPATGVGAPSRVAESASPDRAALQSLITGY